MVAARVIGLQWEAEDIVSVVLASIEAPFPAWEPGAHLDLTLPNGMRRQYSILDDAGDRTRLRVGIDRVIDSRGGSEYVHLFLRPGQIIDVGGPRNHFSLGSEPHWILLAGGIGITPFVSMVKRARATGASWELHYATRQRARLAFLPDVGGADDPRVRLHIGDDGGRVSIDDLVDRAPAGSGVYVCGPERMLQEAEKSVSRREDLVLHLERFRPRPKDLPPPRPFTVTARRSGLELTVPSQRSLLQVLESHGIRVGSGCRTGLCGACEVRVLDGAVEHRDDVLTEGQREGSDVMLPCVSRAVDERLVLDV